MPRFCFDFLSRAARVAFSNTSRTPSLVLAEHSRYLWALIFFLSASPCYTSLISIISDGNPSPCDTYLLGRHGLLAGLAKLLNRLLVVTQILLAANQENGDVAAEMKHLGIPLLVE